MEEYIQAKLNTKGVCSIEEGCLDIIPFIGLQSPLIGKLLQNYIDRCGDL